MATVLARALLICVTLVGLVGCGGLEDVAQGCVDFDGPEFATGELPAATLGRPYEAVVKVELVREPQDDAFDYTFVLGGALPPGLQWRQVGLGERQLLITGTPSAPGDFTFMIHVSVSDPFAEPEEPPALCWTEADRQYRITVGPP